MTRDPLPLATEMPESRQRNRKPSRRYQLEPARRSKKRKKSPRWYGPLVLTVMAVGVIVIVWNYMRAGPSNGLLFGGLGLIAAGFIGTTFWK